MMTDGTMSDATLYTMQLVLRGGPADDVPAESFIGQRIPVMRGDGLPMMPEVIHAEREGWTMTGRPATGSS